MQQMPTNQQEHIMMNKQSGQLPRVKGPELNDRDRLNDILAMEKYLTYGYNVALNEFSHRELYDTVKKILGETHDAHRVCFEQMFNLGWYKLPQQPLDTVALAFNQFQNYQGQFPYPQV